MLNGPVGPDQDEVRATAAHVLGVLLRLLHPAMPFVTEHLWDAMGYGPDCSLIRAPWPARAVVQAPEVARTELDWVVRLVGEVRAVRAEMNVAPSALAPVLLRDAAPHTLARAEAWSEAIRRMARATELGPLAGPMPPGSAQAVLDEATVVIPLAGLIDLEAERARLEKDRAKALGEAREDRPQARQCRLRPPRPARNGRRDPRAPRRLRAGSRPPRRRHRPHHAGAGRMIRGNTPC